MKKSKIILFVFSVCLLIRPIEAFSQWQLIQTSYPNFDEAYDIRFINENTGFVLGSLSTQLHNYGFVQKSTDAGITWEGKVLRDELDSNKRFSRCIKSYFLNETTGFVTGNRWYIFKTTNTGETWRAIDVPSGQNPMIYNDIFFVNESTGYACGRAGYIIKTTDGGENWNLIYQSPYSDVVTIWFVDENNGIAGDLYGGVYKTTNGGVNWQYNQITDHEGVVYAHSKMQFINDNTGFIFGHNLAITPKRSVVFKTTNRGETWNIIYYGLDKHITNGFFFNEFKGFITGIVSYLEYTSNSGLTWENIFVTPISDGLLGIDFINENTGFISSAWGNVFKTTNGGIVSISNSSNSIPEKFHLHQNFPNPFNPSTTISFDIPQASNVKLTVYDALGREVARLVNEHLTAGSYNYQFSTDEYKLTSGVYFYKLVAGDFVETKKFVLMK